MHSNNFEDYFNRIKLLIMLATNDVARVYDTIKCRPGMNDTVKIDLKISRTNLLLLKDILERGITAKDADDKTSS